MSTTIITEISFIHTFLNFLNIWYWSWNN